MEKKFKLKTDGQPLSMPCTKEQWEAIKPELDEIERVNYKDVTPDSFDKEYILVNNFCGYIGYVANLARDYFTTDKKTYLEKHDKEAFLSSLRGEPIVKEEVKQPVTFNDEYWEKLYHECAVRMFAKYPDKRVPNVLRESKKLIEELKNNHLK